MSKQYEASQYWMERDYKTSLRYGLVDQDVATTSTNTLLRILNEGKKSTGNLME